ncbi:MAG TPA: regulatory iron-sulfur-containing complex subunit RicT [Chloroflexota bacterium]|nr:regulatory iron-sulfur-containing complex subunit RicT [Chloroflexota bacterium]
MADVVGVVFQDGNKTYHFDSAGLELSRGDRVVVQTSKGTEIGQVVEPPHFVDDSELPAPLKKVVRVATGKDLESQASGQCLRKEAMATCRELIAQHGLDMKLISADISFGGERITFNFYSDERVDFRALVGDLAKVLKARVELRQVGAREEARMVGGLGPCGRQLCCCLFPGDEEPVSIRMAKEQNLPLNPVKISGQCGRLMCCLKYEQEQYVKFRKEAPPRGTRVSTPTADGVVTGYNVPRDAITVRLEDGTTADLRLSNCEPLAEGGLLFTPDVEEPQPTYTAAEPDYGDRLNAKSGAQTATPEAGDRADSDAAAERGQAAEGAPSGGETGTSKRRRRSRGRRGRGAQAESGQAAAGPAEAGEASTSKRASSGAAKRTGEQAPKEPSKQAGGSRSGHAAAGGQGSGEARPGKDQEAAAEQSDNGERRPRRRRRRRPGSGQASGQAAGESGSGGGGES